MPAGPDAPRARRRGRIAGLLVILIAAGTFGWAAVDRFLPSSTERALAAFTPTADRPDPSTSITGILLQETTVAGNAVDGAPPPSGGSYGPDTVGCDGATYPEPVRNADAVHSLADGAVWITYDPARTPPSVLRALSMRVINDTYLMLSPYPGLDAPVSLQAWGHRLTLDSPEDPRFEQFIEALRANPFTPPEPNGHCGPG